MASDILSQEQPRRQPIPAHMIPSHPPDLSQRIPKLVPRQRQRQRRGVAQSDSTSSAVLSSSSSSSAAAAAASTAGGETTNSSGMKASGPEPATPALAAPLTAAELEQITYTHPVRRIVSVADHRLYLESTTHTLIVGWIFNISDSVQNTAISAVAEQQQTQPDATISAVLRLLDRADALIDAHPPGDNGGSRFGNPMFRQYMDSLSARAPGWLRDELPASQHPQCTDAALDELATYLHASLGSPLRIDYGSGHELHFFIFLLALYRLGVLAGERAVLQRVALVLLPRYLKLMRRLQSSYYLEPAGSHGVWGLDDYHFLPFLVGASQLVAHPFIRPLAIHSAATLDAAAPDYLYLDMVRALEATKTVRGLRWHSPMLDDISGVRQGWPKIYAGLKKMLLGEVLGKLVVMQHFLFGALVPAVEGMMTTTGSGSGLEAHSHSHPHSHSHAHLHKGEGEERGWDDCCGIRVPGAAGAAQEEFKKRMGLGSQQLRPLPFD